MSQSSTCYRKVYWSGCYAANLVIFSFHFSTSVLLISNICTEHGVVIAQVIVHGYRRKLHPNTLTYNSLCLQTATGKFRDKLSYSPLLSLPQWEISPFFSVLPWISAPIPLHTQKGELPCGIILTEPPPCHHHHHSQSWSQVGREVRHRWRTQYPSTCTGASYEKLATLH